MARIYTRKGDTGTSTLTGRKRIPKNDARFALLGDLDELNSHLGLVKALSNDSQEQTFIETAQGKIIQLSSFVCNPTKEENRMTQEDIESIEKRIDALSTAYKRTSFTIPGVSVPSAHADICRAVCRRSERSFMEVSQNNDIDPNALTYINRLSDYLYMLARALERQDAPEKDNKQ